VSDWLHAPSVLLACAAVYRVQFKDSKRSTALAEEALRKNGFLTDAMVEIALGLELRDERRSKLLHRATTIAPWNDWARRVLADDLFYTRQPEKAFDCLARAHHRLPPNISILIAWTERLRDHAADAKDDDAKNRYYNEAEE